MRYVWGWVLLNLWGVGVCCMFGVLALLYLWEVKSCGVCWDGSCCICWVVPCSMYEEGIYIMYRELSLAVCVWRWQVFRYV